MRRLQVTIAGRWYLALTILLGVVALTSGNNIIYLIESMLLSGMILSGILSEKTVSGIEVNIQRAHACAGADCNDYFQITNVTSIPLYCLEIGEWNRRKFERLAFIEKIGPHEKISVRGARTFEKRGTHLWDGIAIATSYPFDFARKIKVIDDPGERLIWPARLSIQESRSFPTDQSGARQGSTFSEGEVRAMLPDDDYRSIVWTLSAKGTEALVRQRRSHHPSVETVVDLRVNDGPEFEMKVKAAANAFYRSEMLNGDSGSLTILNSVGKRRVIGKIKALNELAILKAEGEAS